MITKRPTRRGPRSAAVAVLATMALVASACSSGGSAAGPSGSAGSSGSAAAGGSSGAAVSSGAAPSSVTSSAASSAAAQDSAAASAASGQASAATGSPISLAIVAELSGTSSAIGEQWKDGADAAVAEINAAGGILGHKVTTFTADTQSDAAKSTSAIRFALTKKPFAVMGPVLSSSIMVDIPITAKAQVPEVVGGVADEISQQGDGFLLRAAPSSSDESNVISKFLAENVKAHHVAIVYVNDARGQSASSTLSKDLKARKVDSDLVAISPDQTNFSGTAAKIVGSGADAIYLSAVPTQDAQVIQALKQAGLGSNVTLTGDSDALSSTVSQLTNNASDGIRGVVDFSPGAQGFSQIAATYAAKHNGTQPTANYYKSYIWTWLLAYAAKGAGSLDPSAMMKYLHERSFCAATYPKLLQNVFVKSNGDPDGPEYVAEVTGGQQKVIGTVKPLDESKFTQCSAG